LGPHLCWAVLRRLGFIREVGEWSEWKTRFAELAGFAEKEP
jgi:hypothetical protein